MVIILWWIEISIVVLMGIMVFLVLFLLILMLISPDVYICGVIIIFRVHQSPHTLLQYCHHQLQQDYLYDNKT